MGCITTKQVADSIQTRREQDGPKNVSTKVHPAGPIQVDASPNLKNTSERPSQLDSTSKTPITSMPETKDPQPQQQPPVQEKVIEKPPVKEVKQEKKEKLEEKKPKERPVKKEDVKKKPPVNTEPIVEKEIYPNFRKLGFAKYDEVFSKASVLLATAEKIRSGVEDSKQKSIYLSNTFQLKEYSLLETVRVLLWAVSANCKGKIASTGIKVSAEAPFMNLPQLKKMMEEAQELYTVFGKYLKAVTEGTDAVKNVEQSLTELSEQAKALTQQGQKEILESSLPEEEKQRIINRLTRYAEKYLPNELEKTKKIIPLIQKELEEITKIAPHLEELFNKADEIGAKVFNDYTTQLKNATDPEQEEDIQFILAPARIFNMYSTNETKSPAEIEAYMAAMKNAEENALRAKAAHEREDKD